MKKDLGKLFFLLFILFTLSSCSLFKSSVTFRNPDFEFEGIQTPTSDIPIYKKFECIPSTDVSETGFVVDVIDGDSIKVMIDDKVYELRYIGINTPEYYSNEKAEAELATLENKKMVKGKKVYLFKDRSNTDKYHRLLRYVFTDEFFVNYEMVKSGLAESKSYFPDTSCQALLDRAVH